MMLVVVIFQSFLRHIGLERVIGVGKIGKREAHLKSLSIGRRRARWPADGGGATTRPSGIKALPARINPSDDLGKLLRGRDFPT
jgi:hypothetical protein